MSDPSLSEDGKAHAEWAILSAEDIRTYIIDGMKPIDISSDVLSVFDPESSMLVLQFEMYRND